MNFHRKNNRVVIESALSYTTTKVLPPMPEHLDPAQIWQACLNVIGVAITAEAISMGMSVDQVADNMIKADEMFEVLNSTPEQLQQFVADLWDGLNNQ